MSLFANKREKLFLCIFSLFLLFSCSTAGHKREKGAELDRWIAEDGKLRVLCTIGMIHDLVCMVGGEHVKSLALIQGDLDPHSYELVKGDGEKLKYADLIFYNGLGLEHGPSLKHSLRSSPSAVALGDRVKERFSEAILYLDGVVDPHIWMDISMWVRLLPLIAEELGKSDSENAVYYLQRAEAFEKEMMDAHRQVRALLQSVPEGKRYLVTSHDAFNYFTRAYLAQDTEKTMEQWSKRFQAPEGLAPEAQISTIDIQKVIDHLSFYGITVLFPESNVSQDSIKKIVSAGKELGLDLQIAQVHLYGDAMGSEGSSGDSYLKMIQHNATTIAGFLNRQNHATKYEQD